MRKFVFIGLLILLIPSLTHSQDSSPEYAFAYGLTDGEVRVARIVNEDWLQTRVPARVLFGRADVELALPKWSPDGSTLYVTTFDPLEENVAVNLEAYNILTDELTPILAVVPLEAMEFAFEFARIDSISPDGRYAWVTQVVSYRTHLVDLENKTIVTTTECPVNVLTWQPETVIVACNGQLFAEPQIFSVSLSSGERVQAFVPPSENTQPLQATYTQEGHFLTSGRYLVGSSDPGLPSSIGLLETDRYAGQYLGVGTQLQVNSSEEYLAFIQNERLQKVNLETLQFTNVGKAVGNFQWQGEALLFWRTQTNVNGDFQIIRVEARNQYRRETVIYSGLEPQNIDFSPLDDFVALEFQPVPGQSYVELHGRDGLVWVSDFEYPQSYVQLQFQVDRPISWSENGEWIHLQYSPDLRTFPRTLSVNVITGDSILAPEAQAKFVGEAPDGEWWLYMVTGDPLETPTNRLLAYRWAEDDLHILAEEVPLYDDPQFPLWRYIVWSK